MVKKGDLLLEMNKVQKRFGGAVALRGTDLKIRAGEIHASFHGSGATWEHQSEAALFRVQGSYLLWRDVPERFHYNDTL